MKHVLSLLLILNFLSATVGQSVITNGVSQSLSEKSWKLRDQASLRSMRRIMAT